MKLFETDRSVARDSSVNLVPDMRRDPTMPTVAYPQEYDDQAAIKLVCTQHSEILSDKRQKEVTKGWVAFLSEQPLPLQRVQLVTRTPKSVFEAICRQKTIEELRFKWLATADLSPITQLKDLKKLQIELGSSLADLSPLSELTKLETLILGSTKKVTDYSPLGKLHNLKELVICSYPTRVPGDVMHMESDAFLSQMPALSYLDLADVRIHQRLFLNEETATRYDYACFRL